MIGESDDNLAARWANSLSDIRAGLEDHRRVREVDAGIFGIASRGSWL